MIFDVNCNNIDYFVKFNIMPTPLYNALCNKIL